jgi:hypothetical protein
MLTGFPARAVTSVVIQPAGSRIPLGQPAVLGAAPGRPVATVEPAAPVDPAMIPGVLRDGHAGMTSEPQAGHR